MERITESTYHRGIEIQVTYELDGIDRRVIRADIVTPSRIIRKPSLRAAKMWIAYNTGDNPPQRKDWTKVKPEWSMTNPMLELYRPDGTLLKKTCDYRCQAHARAFWPRDVVKSIKVHKDFDQR